MATTIREADLVESVADALQSTFHYHPDGSYPDAERGALSRSINGCGSAAAIG